MKKIILASGSPRRRELLALVYGKIRGTGKAMLAVSSIPIAIQYCKIIRRLMAEKTASDREEDCGRIIIGADTVVAHEGKILGKPKDKEDAARMLEALQGDAHDVYTGVAVICYDKEGQEEVISHAVQTKVYVDVMTEEEIQSYIATGEPMDKAGAYGIQGRFAAHIAKIDGDYYNVVGLPVSYIYKVLREKI